MPRTTIASNAPPPTPNGSPSTTASSSVWIVPEPTVVSEFKFHLWGHLKWTILLRYRKGCYCMGAIGSLESSWVCIIWVMSPWTPDTSPRHVSSIETDSSKWQNLMRYSYSVRTCIRHFLWKRVNWVYMEWGIVICLEQIKMHKTDPTTLESSKEIVRIVKEI